MNKSLQRAEFFSFLAASLLGVIFHFVYDWTGGNFLAGLFFPVNESTWEHLKLIYFPLILVSAAEYRLGLSKSGEMSPRCFACIKFRSALLGMASVVILFYTYTGILGRSVDWVNIAVFILSMGISYLYSYRKLASGDSRCPTTLCLLGIFLFAVLFMVFTVYPPDIALFEDPVIAGSNMHL